MKSWLVALLVVLGCSKHAVDHKVIDDFRATERTTLLRFNDLLREQRDNAIDEVTLGDAIDKEVLPPWRELRARVDAAPVPESETELYATLKRYIAERQTAWEAYSAGLHSPNDEAAKPHYATYHQQNDAATADAQKLGEAFRKL